MMLDEEEGEEVRRVSTFGQQCDGCGTHINLFWPTSVEGRGSEKGGQT